MQPTYSSQDTSPTPPPNNENLSIAANKSNKKSLNKLVITLVLLLILALGGIYFVYSWQHKKIIDLNKQLQASSSTNSLVEQVSSGKPATYENVTLVNGSYSYSFQFSKNPLTTSANGNNLLTGTALDGRTLITVSAKNTAQDPITTTCPTSTTEVTKVIISNQTYSVCNISSSGYIYDVTFQVGSLKHFMVISTADGKTTVDTETLKTIMQSIKVSTH